MFDIESSLTRLVALSYLRHRGAVLSGRDCFQRWVNEQFMRLPIRHEWVNYDPYPDSECMRIDLAATGILKITTRNNQAVLDPKVNLMFRAVHDFDHCRFGYRFGMGGETLAGRSIMSRCADQTGRQFVFSEIIAQAAVHLETGRFPKQKFVPFPVGLIDDLVLGA